MTGSSKPRDDLGTAADHGLEGLSAEIAAADPTALQALVSILTRIEGALETIADGPLAALMNTMAEGIRAIVLNEVADGAKAIGAIAEAARIIEMGATGETAAKAEQALRAALDSAPTEIEGTTLPSLNDIAARLIGLGLDDGDALRNVCKELEGWAVRDGLPSDVIEPLRVAAAFIEQAVLGSTDDPAKSLASAEDFLANAIDAFERAESDDGEADNGEPEETEADSTLEAASAPALSEQGEPTVPKPQPGAAVPSSAGEAFLPADADMEILKDYIVESLDHIEAAETLLLAVESDPDDIEQINTIFRAFHTIKGTSGFFGLNHNQQLAHLAENLLDRARSGDLRLVGGYADLCLRSCDMLRSMIESVQQAVPGGSLALPDGLDELFTQLSDPAAAGISEDDHTEPMRVGDILVAKGAADRDAVEAAAASPGTERLGEKLIKQKTARPQDVASALRTQKQSGGGVADSSVRVSTDRLDAMVNMVGELVIAQSMVAADADGHASDTARLVRHVAHAGKIVRDLQDLTMSLRMVPLKSLFNKMVRLVRDLARKSDKSVRLVTEGEDTEIDRNMVESLNDPLLHMIRNAVDHGIESPEERTRCGKPSSGTVCLRAYHSAGNVVIEMADDGQGLNREKILAKAIDRGLIDAGRKLPDAEAYSLIWHPGFSTAEKVTDVSGRGVGMDVVKRSIEELRGRVEVASEPGRGSTFTLRLPLTMAIADAMLIRVGGERFLVPTISIEQSFRPTPEELSTIVGRGEMVMLRGNLLPICRLHRLFGVPDAITDITDGLLIVIEGEGKRCAVMVDELLGQQQVVIKTLGATFGDVKGVAGAAILGDGDVGLILDAGGLILLAMENDLESREALQLAG